MNIQVKYTLEYSSEVTIGNVKFSFWYGVNFRRCYRFTISIEDSLEISCEYSSEYSLENGPPELS